MKRLLVGLLVSFSVFAEVQSFSPSVTASRAVASDSGGLLTASSATATELGYLAGVSNAKSLAAKVIVHADTSNTALSGITTVVYSNEITDSDAAYNPANGTFTVPAGKGGEYLVAASWQTSGAETWVAGNQAVSWIQVNGSNARLSAQFPPGASGMNVLVSICHVVTVAAGDTIRITALGTPNPTLSNNAAQNKLDIIGPF